MTIVEIAKKAGVSNMTVSNVINGKTKKVSKATAEKINKIIKETHYTPNLNARSLSSPSSKIIAVFVPLVENQKNINLFLNPYLSEMIGIFEEYFREKGYYSMLRSIDTVEAVCSFIDNWNLDGAIMVYPYFEKEIEILKKEAKIPLVYLDFSHPTFDGLTINIEDQKGIYLATKYLIELGHKKIAFVGNYENNHLVMARYKGYIQALQEAGIPLNENYVYKVLPDYDSGIVAGRDIAKKRQVTAVVTTADFSASGVIEGARDMGFSIPEDLSVTGFDNTLLSSLAYPKLTTVDQHIDKKAKVAAKLLIDRISGKNELNQHLVLDVDLVKRGSTSKPRKDL
ncbi:MAG: LacI family DNA-binding transcriptional regulator [Sphaerochaetaceae bacterium]|nr:LacI family DNA-binding transcriptional regulator [Sphaerochaetaceae bacterium]